MPTIGPVIKPRSTHITPNAPEEIHQFPAVIQSIGAPTRFLWHFDCSRDRCPPRRRALDWSNLRRGNPSRKLNCGCNPSCLEGWSKSRTRSRRLAKNLWRGWICYRRREGIGLMESNLQARFDGLFVDAPTCNDARMALVKRDAAVCLAMTLPPGLAGEHGRIGPSVEG